MDNKKVIEEESITDNLKLTTAMTFDEERIFLIVDYLNGKFTIEKNFKNNYFELEDFNKAKKQFSTEENVKKYFGL